MAYVYTRARARVCSIRARAHIPKGQLFSRLFLTTSDLEAALRANISRGSFFDVLFRSLLRSLESSPLEGYRVTHTRDSLTTSHNANAAENAIER